MVQIVALLALVALVFGALLASGTGIARALPFELFLLCGAALGTLLVGNAPAVAGEALKGFWVALRGPKWRKADYVALLVLMHSLTLRARRGGLVSIEDDIEHPEGSAAFQAAPRLLADAAARGLICDTFRLIGLDLSDPARAEDAMARRLATHADARQRAVSALHTMADALPALGIVVAVIGIIRAMGVIDQSPSVIGAMIAAALLGTFLGVFLSYGIVGPIATRFGQVLEEEDGLLEAIRAVLSAYGAGHPPLTCVELARASIDARVRPDADLLGQAIQRARFDTRQAAA